MPSIPLHSYSFPSRHNPSIPSLVHRKLSPHPTTTECAVGGGVAAGGSGCTGVGGWRRRIGGRVGISSDGRVAGDRRVGDVGAGRIEDGSERVDYCLASSVRSAVGAGAVDDAAWRVNVRVRDGGVVRHRVIIVDNSRVAIVRDRGIIVRD